MENFKMYAIYFCISMIISAVVIFIIPEGPTKKLYMHIISIFIFAVILFPVKNLKIGEFKAFQSGEYAKIIDSEEYSLMFDEYIYDSFENEIKNQVKQVLNNFGLEKYDINLVLNKTSEESYVLKRIVITINQDDMRFISSIRTNVSKITGIIPEVVFFD